MDPTRRRWWDGEQWTTILTRPMAELAAAPGSTPAAAPVMGDGTMLPYATDARPQAGGDEKHESAAGADEPSNRPSRVRILQMALALVAILATAAVVFAGRGEEPAPELADTTFEGPAVTVATTTTVAPTTTVPTTTEPATTVPPVDEPEANAEPVAEADADPEAERVEAPSYRGAYDACQVILDGSSIGAGGLDYQTFRDIEAVSADGVTELRFEATDADGATDAYLCRSYLNGDDGSVMVGRLYLDLQNVLTGD